MAKTIFPDGMELFNIASYGAVPNDSSEAAGALNVAAFNSAIAAARVAGGYTYIPNGTWYVDDVITWTHLKDTGPVIIKGTGPETSIIKPTAAMITSDKNIIHIVGSESPGTYQYISYFSLEDFSICANSGDYSGTSNAYGIVVGKAAIGDTDYAVDSFKKMHVKNIFIEYMRQGLLIYNSRQIQLDNIVIRTDVANNKCLYITCWDGSFAGDIVCYNCEFISDTNGTGQPITITADGLNSEVRGIHFMDCTMYFGDVGTYLYATNLGNLKDLWFTSCVWDGPSQTQDAIKIENVGGFLRGIQISNPYIVNWENCIVIACTGNFDTLSDININGGYIGYCSGYGINIYQGMGYAIQGINFFDVANTTAGAGIINIGNVPSTGYRDGCTEISITGNTYTQSDLNPVVDHFIHLGTGIQNYAISNNSGAPQLRCIQDESDAPSGRKWNNRGGAGSGISNWDVLRIGQGDYTTILSGTFARIASRHELHPETGTSDTLNTITGGLSGDFLVLCGPGNSDQITITNKFSGGGENSFITSNDTNVLLDWYDVIFFMYNGWNWVELGRSLNVTDELWTRTALSQLTATPTFNNQKITGITSGTASGHAIEYDQFNAHVSSAIIDSDFSEPEGFMRKTGAGAYEAIKSNLTASIAPTANEDSGDGYSVGSIWIDTTADKAYCCLDATPTAAVWTEISAAAVAAHATEHVTGGSDVIANVIASGNSGLMNGTDKTKLNGVETNADITDAVNIASSIVGVTAKTTPANADSFGIIDSAAANVLKELTWTNVKAALKTYFDALYAATLGEDDNYVTDDEKVIIGNTSGTNTGDDSANDTAYNATSWDANTDAATKNSIRDKIESMLTAIGLNTAKDTNVSTNLSEGTNTVTTVDINSSDGTNATLVSADTTRAGLLTKAKFDEIVVNTTKNSYPSADATKLGTIETNAKDNQNANEVPNTPAGNIAATNVQAAINELDTEKAPIASPTFTGTVTLAANPATSLEAATKAYVDNRTSDMVSIEEYGAIPDDDTEAATNVTAFNNAITYARTNGLTVYIPPGIWYVNDEISWIHDFSVGPVYIVGASTTKSIITPTDNTKDVIVIYGTDAPDYHYISQFELSNFSIKSSETYTTLKTGITLGKANDGTAYYVDAFAWNSINDVFIENMPIGIKIFNTRHIALNRVVTRTNKTGGAYGLYVYQHDAQFTGDVFCHGCEFVTPISTGNYTIYLDASGANSSLRGNHFTDCITYTGEISTYVKNRTGAQIGDLWFTSCAWDGPDGNGDQGATTGINIDNVGATMFGIHIIEPYIVNYTDYGITASNTGTVTDMNQIYVSGGQISLCNKNAINIYGGSNIGITNVIANNIRESTLGGSAAFTFSGTSENITIIGNSHFITSGTIKINTVVSIAAGATQYTVLGNSGESLYGTVADNASHATGRVAYNTPDAETIIAHATEHVTGGSDVIANVIASGNSGLMNGTDKTKLDTVQTNAQEVNWGNVATAFSEASSNANMNGYRFNNCAAGSVTGDLVEYDQFNAAIPPTQKGTVTDTTTSGGLITVNFGSAFASTPVVIVQIEGDVDYYAVIISKSTTSFTVKILKTGHTHTQGNSGSTSGGTPSGSNGNGGAHIHTQGVTGGPSATIQYGLPANIATKYAATSSGGSPTSSFIASETLQYPAVPTSSHTHTNPNVSTHGGHTHTFNGNALGGHTHTNPSTAASNAGNTLVSASATFSYIAME